MYALLQVLWSGQHNKIHKLPKCVHNFGENPSKTSLEIFPSAANQGHVVTHIFKNYAFLTQTPQIVPLPII